MSTTKPITDSDRIEWLDWFIQGDGQRVKFSEYDGEITMEIYHSGTVLTGRHLRDVIDEAMHLFPVKFKGDLE